jgi:AcrR family transcriptional regulator
MPDVPPAVSAADQSLGQFVAAARRCFARAGVRGTTMAAVAAEAGLSRPYLYRLVSSREELLELALIDRAREFTELLAERAVKAARKGSLLDAFVDHLRYAVRFGRNDPEFVALAAALPRARVNHVLTGADSPLHGFTLDALGPLFARGRAEGSLRTDVTPEAMVDWLQSVMALVSSRDDLSEEAERRLLRDFALRGVLDTPQ